MDKVSAERLRDKVNAMLKEVAELPNELRPQGVNWADLKVCDIVGEVSYLYGGKTYIFVEVDEASPECSEWFTKRLAEPDIEIRCKW